MYTHVLTVFNSSGQTILRPSNSGMHSLWPMHLHGYYSVLFV